MVVLLLFINMCFKYYIETDQMFTHFDVVELDEMMKSILMAIFFYRKTLKLMDIISF